MNLVGHDWGGVVGFLVCLNHPDRVERFVPMNTGHVWPTMSMKALPKAARRTRLLGPARKPVRGAAHGWARRASAERPSTRRSRRRPTPSSTGARQLYGARFKDPARAKAASQVYRTFALHEYSQAWLRGRYAGRAPDDADAVAARRSKIPVIRPGQIKNIADHADDVRIEYLEDCGHFPPEERPDLVASELREFFSSAAHISPRD